MREHSRDTCSGTGPEKLYVEGQMQTFRLCRPHGPCCKDSAPP